MTIKTQIGKRPPVFPGHWLWGHTGGYLRDPLKILSEAHRLGDVVEIPGVRGFAPWFLVTRPELIAECLHTRQHLYSKAELFIRSAAIAARRGILTLEGKEWSQRRRMEQPYFHPEKLSEFVSDMVSCVESVIPRWEEAVRTGEPLDLASEMGAIAFNVICKALFGDDLPKDISSIREMVQPIIRYLHRRRTTPLGLMPAWLVPPPVAFRRSLKAMCDLVARVVQSRRGAPLSFDFLSMLLSMEDAENHDRLTLKDIQDEVLTFLVAGHETIGSALSWCWYLLATHPMEAQRLRNEVQKKLNGDRPTAKTLMEMVFAQRVVDEAMRLYPPTLAVNRQAVDDNQLGEFHVPKGTLMVFCQYLTHRDPRYWSDPDVFQPDRFSEENSVGRHRYAYFPFSGGPRICIGRHFALMEGVAVLAVLAGRYRAHLMPQASGEIFSSFTLVPRNGVPARLEHW